MKTQLYIVSLVIVSIAACNYSSECWPRGQGDSEGAGSGTVDSTGPGNPGEGPTGEAQGALTGDQCNDPETPPPDNGTTELNQVLCPPQLSSVECAALCTMEGAPCPGALTNKDNPSAGLGKLSMCCGCPGKRYCKYVYDNLDQCYLYLDKARPFNWKCVYLGGG